MEPAIKIIKARPIPSQNSADMEWIERLARWMDSRFLIPGTNIRFGLDPLFSLFPILGDLITYIISGAEQMIAM
jgi:hypothetical protein